MRQIGFSKVRYIKLGPNGKWEQQCLDDGTMRLGYYEIPHDLGLNGDKQAISDIYLKRDLTKGAASNHASQVMKFYDDDPEVLWITFSNGYLYWAQMLPEVEYLGSNENEHPIGSRLRRSRDGWHKTSILGTELRISTLSGSLAKVAAYRQTCCDVKQPEVDYLRAKLHDQLLPVVKACVEAKKQLLKTTEHLIERLTWQDFELFTDLIFSHSGWQRINAIGGTQKTLDLELILPITNERAIVQVKSKTSQAMLDDFVAATKTRNEDKYFFAYHSSDRPLETRASDVILMDVTALSEHAFKAGLIDWLIEKVG